MKKILVIGAMLGVMLLASDLQRGSGTSAATLAAIGFVVLTAYAVAELGKQFSLPQVTGYIVAGVALGPSVGSIISGDVVSEMRMFNTLALGLIATSAGLELDVAQIGRLGKTLLLTISLKIVVGVALVAGTLLVVEHALDSLGLLGQGGKLPAVALVLGVLSIGTSPAIVLAVLSETRAKGRLSELVLGAAIFKDLVVVVGLAIAVAVGRVALEPGASLDTAIFASVGRELGGSIVAGAIVGAIFIAYVRFIGAEMLLFVAAMILVVAELCRAFHLELLLVFIAAGFTVRNFSKLEHRLMHPLEMVALPVFVVFFTNAGASIDLLTTFRILPLALALCLARVVGYVVASRLGGKWAGESADVQRLAWMAYLPQAGVTLGLVGLAGLQLPELAVPIANTGMAVVAINLLVGPLALRRALGQAGELPPLAPASGAQPPSHGAESETGHAPGSLPESSPPEGQVAESQPSPDSATNAALRAGLPPRARRVLDDLQRELGDALARFERDTAPQLPRLPGLDETPDLDVFRRLVTGHQRANQALYAELSGVVGRLPITADAGELWADDPGGSDKAGWGRGSGPDVPLRRIARIALEPVMAAHVAQLFEGGLRRRVTTEQGESRPPDAREEVVPAEFSAGLGRLARLLSDVALRRVPSRQLRYSDAEPEVRQRLKALLGETEDDLARVVRAAWAGRILERSVATITAAVRRIVDEHVVHVSREVVAGVEPAIRSLAGWLQTQSTDDIAPERAQFAELRVEFERRVKEDLTALSRGFRVSTAIRETTTALRDEISGLPGSLECLYLGPDDRLYQGKVRTVRLRARADAYVRQLAPAIDVAARAISNALAQARSRTLAAVQSEWSQLEAQEETHSAASPQVDERLARAGRRVELVARFTRRTVDGSLLGLEAAIEAETQSFVADVTPAGAQRHRRSVGLQRQIAWLRDIGQRAARWLRGALSSGRHLTDAAAVRRSLGSGHELPASVGRWFASQPVNDERIFAAHRQLLESIVDAESLHLEGGHASVLIVGSAGSGKSSLLNMCELESRSRMPLRLHADAFDKKTTLMTAIAALLEVPPTNVALRRQMALHRPSLFVDDLGSWLCAAPDRHAELSRLLQMVADTRQVALWVVTVDAAMLELLRELETPEEVFTNVVHLPRLGLAEVKKLVQSRVDHAHLAVSLQPTRLGRLLEQMRAIGPGDQIFRSLWSASGGNPGEVVALCREAFEVVGSGVALRPSRIRAARRLPFAFSDVHLAILLSLCRYGPLARARLTREVAVTPDQTARGVAFLVACGLVTASEDDDRVAITERSRWTVQRTLEEARLWGA